MSLRVLLPLALVAFCLHAAEQDEVALLRWAGPEPGPTGYDEWLAENPITEFSAKLDRVAGTFGGARVAILTQSTLASALAADINRLIASLNAEGYTVLSYQVSGGTAAQLRDLLAGMYASDSIEGALFIGSLPVPWFQIEDDFNQYGYAEWPTDLFFMDLDGVWLDTLTRSGDSLIAGTDGRYDTHTGNMYPEIYVGRLTPTGIGTASTTISNYLRKDNAFRLDSIFLPEEALVFVDDDWIPSSATWAANVALLYSDTSNVFHAETTRASIYRPRLDTPRAWVSVFAHSSASLHSFRYNNRASSDIYNGSEYGTQNPPANFYNHFACSFARYTSSGYGSGRSVFNQSYGLGAIGSTKTGSMLDFSYFYGPLGQGKNLGQAYKDWFSHIIDYGVTFNELCWHYGMTLLGDPFLKPVGRRGAAAIRILAPSGTVDTGSFHTPQAVVRNMSRRSLSVPVNLRIGSLYSSTVSTAVLGPNDSAVVSFAGWTASARGNHTVTCSTRLAWDDNPADDTVRSAVTVNVTDLAATRLVAPAGAIDSGTTVTPQVLVFNRGTTNRSSGVVLHIGATYRDSVELAGLAPGDSALVSFADWTAADRGTNAITCSLKLAGDHVLANNQLHDSVMVNVSDVAVRGIVAPTGTVEPGSVIAPAVRVGNLGNSAADFGVMVVLLNPLGDEAYCETLSVSGLAPGVDTVLNSFPECRLDLLGRWTTLCRTWSAPDMRPENDSASSGFGVAPTQSAPWVEKRPMPASPSGKAVKDGGWLAADRGTGLVYAAKGNKSADFFVYDPARDSWTAAAVIPDGNEMKKPGKGAAGCANGAGVIYATKGNNTQGFWRYDATRDSWRQLADVPLGASNKKVKGGTDLVFHDGSVYLLKGYKNEFWRYDPALDSWCSLAAAPADKYDKGSWLAPGLEPVLYCHQAKYHGFYSYDIATQSWGSALSGMSFINQAGKSKKSKDGGSASLLGSHVYALKGGNTQEFWRYDPGLDSWDELDTMPQMGMTGKKKKVKAGADLVACGDLLLYALKGGGVNELWRYVPGQAQAQAQAQTRTGVMSGVVRDASGVMRISPNPLRAGSAIARLDTRSLYPFVPLSLSVFDATGRLVLHSSFELRASSLRLDLRSMRPGVYLLRLDTGDRTLTQKLVIQQ